VFFIPTMICGQAHGQSLDEIKTLWQRAIDELGRGEREHAQTTFGEFNERIRAYATANGRDWQIEYLIGSLYCQFSDSRASGANFLRDILVTNRDLNDNGVTEVRRQLVACARLTALPDGDHQQPTPPQDLVFVAAHFQLPGVHGDMKGGARYKLNRESAAKVSPMRAAELIGRRVQVSQPEIALKGALGRLQNGATGALVDRFAVVSTALDKKGTAGVGDCLKNYLSPLANQFEIRPSDYMVTVYVAQGTADVYALAGKLHGLDLPDGVIAYSVPEDLSLVAVADAFSCGSAAHELVHLLIKRNFPMSPAWLEEGLASEVAVASVVQDRFRFNPSWRDDTLRRYLGLRPRVAVLLNSSWSDFNTNGFFQGESVATTQAMAAVFIRYLDSKGKLSSVYFAVRDHHLSADLSKYRSYGEIVEEELGMSLEEIDQDFARWIGPR
jgi:hypothetical protein